MKTMICCCLIGDFLDFFLAGFFIAWIPVGLLDHVKAKRPLVDGEVALVNCQSGGKEHRHIACAANGHPCPVLLTQRSATPLAAQTPSLCSYKPTLHLLAISNPIDNKRALPEWAPRYFSQYGFSSQSFWKRGSFRSGSNIGSSRSSAGVIGTTVVASGPSYGIDSSFCKAVMARSGSPMRAATRARISIGQGPSMGSFSIGITAMARSARLNAAALSPRPILVSARSPRR